VTLPRLAWAAFALATAHVAVGVVMAVAGNEEGIGGALLYVALFALPLVVIGLGLRSTEARRRSTAGWAALVLAAYYPFVVIGNWSGYTGSEAALALGASLPTSALELLIFRAVIMGGSRGYPRTQ
jgi:hypothetical protein